MKKRLAMTVMTTMILTAALAGCGTDNSSAKAAGQLPAELIASIELLEISEESTPVAGELLADAGETEEIAEEPTAPADTATVDRPVTGKNNTGNATAANNMGSTAPAVSNTNTSSAADKGTTGGTGSTGTTTPSAPTPAANTPAASAPTADTQAPAQQHMHVYEYHEATGHYEIQIVKEAWDEPVYEYRQVCAGCGHQSLTDDEAAIHCIECPSGLGWSSQKIQIGTIHHDAETGEVWVEDTPAYRECRCGARQ